MYAISPDGQEVAYTSNIDEVEVTSTNNEIFVVPMTAAHQRKFPPVPVPTPRRSIRRTENISPGARKRAPVSKPINGGSSSKIENRERSKIYSETFDRSAGSFCWNRLDTIWLSYEEYGQSFITSVHPPSETAIAKSQMWPRHDTHADDLVRRR